MTSPKSESITPLCRADSLFPHTACHSPVSPPEAMQLVDLVSALCTLFFTPGIKTASTSHKALSQNRTRKLCWPQTVPCTLPPCHITRCSRGAGHVLFASITTVISENPWETMAFQSGGFASPTASDVSEQHFIYLFQ